MIEKNHEYIRLVTLKGRSLDCYTQEDAVLLMNHIKSEARDSLFQCPEDSFTCGMWNLVIHAFSGCPFGMPKFLDKPRIMTKF